MILQAQSVAVAEIWLWQVGSWKPLGRLQSHSLTVTQMEFSHDDKFLLAVSRDRQFSIFSIMRTGVHQLLTRQEAHKRIVWACSWNPFGHEFCTGSRDKTVKIWALEKDSSVKHLTALPPFKSSVTAVCWVGLDRQSNYGFLAVGMENCLTELWSISNQRSEDGFALAPNVSLIMRFDPFICHVSSVNRLVWRNTEKKNCRNMELASCGADHCVRVYNINVF